MPALNSDFLIDGGSYTENVVQVIPPNPSLLRGRIIVSAGSPQKILYRPLYNSQGAIDRSSLASSNKPPMTATMDYPTGPTSAVHTDNGFVRLKDGSLLMARSAAFWDSITPNPPAWAGITITDGYSSHAGMRGATQFFRSTDNGSTWQARSRIDFATVLDGMYGVPRQNDKGDSEPPFFGDADREEIYACPFTGNVYYTSYAIGGGYEKTAQHQAFLLFYSRNNAASWELISGNVAASTPIVMTSTPDGRLYLFGSNCIFQYSTNPILSSSSTTPELSAGYQVYYVENGTSVAAAGSDSVDLQLKLAPPTISRISTDKTTRKVRIAYPTKNASGMQELRIIRVEVDKPGQAPKVTPVAAIKAPDPQNYSVMYANFIDPNYVDMPAGVTSNTSVLYWIEAPRIGLSNKQYQVKYVVVEGDGDVSSPENLSVLQGKPRTWGAQGDIGDYMYGGSFWKGNALHYLAQWCEQGAGIKGNVVSIPCWELVGRGVASRPAAVSWGPNRLDIFALGSANRLYHKWWDTTAWGPAADPNNWHNLGGKIVGSPSAVSWGANRLDVFARGLDSRVYHKWWDTTAWGPSADPNDWHLLGGETFFGTSPAVVSRGPNRLDVCVTGLDKRVYHKWWDSAGWGPSADPNDWHILGGGTVNSPTVVSWGPDRLDVIVKGLDNRVYHKWWDGSGWGPSADPNDWAVIGGNIASALSIARVIEPAVATIIEPA